MPTGTELGQKWPCLSRVDAEFLRYRSRLKSVLEPLGSKVNQLHVCVRSVTSKMTIVFHDLAVRVADPIANVALWHPGSEGLADEEMPERMEPAI